MGSLGPSELLIIFLIVLLLFGSKKIPEMARGLGKGIREFQKASRDIQNEISRIDYDPKPAKPSKPVTPKETDNTSEQEKAPDQELS